MAKDDIKADSKITHLLVRARGAKFRRCNREFYGEAYTSIPLSELSSDELARLEGESMLHTSRVSAAAAAEAEAKAAKARPVSKDRLERLEAEVAELKADRKRLQEQLVAAIDQGRLAPPLS